MATSGTFNFSMDIDEIIQEALEMIGGEETLGHEPKSARRSINLILQDWQNRGVMLWTANTSVVTLATSVTTLLLALQQLMFLRL
jgi:kynureninase